MVLPTIMGSVNIFGQTLRLQRSDISRGATLLHFVLYKTIHLAPVAITFAVSGYNKRERGQ
jgi:hypothetical protein